MSYSNDEIVKRLYDKYYHTWFNYEDQEIYVKYIYINEYDFPHWTNVVFIGRDKEDNYKRLNISYEKFRDIC